jgi:chromosome partitioning protein
VARILAITNQKGGVGKTTTAVNLAASLAVAEQRTLLVDMDPQGNASSALGIAREDIRSGTYEVLLGDAPIADAILRSVQFSHLDLLPTTQDLAGAEVELVDDDARATRLRDALHTVRDQYDVILLDCPPSLGLLTLNALVGADAVLIPLQCEYFALEGLSQLLETVDRVRALNPALAVDGVLLTMYDARLNLSRQVAADARAHFGDRVFTTMIPRNIRLAEAPSFGKPIVVYDLASVGAQAYWDADSTPSWGSAKPSCRGREPPHPPPNSPPGGVPPPVHPRRRAPRSAPRSPPPRRRPPPPPPAPSSPCRWGRSSPTPSSPARSSAPTSWPTWKPPSASTASCSRSRSAPPPTASATSSSPANGASAPPPAWDGRKSPRWSAAWTTARCSRWP